MQNSPDLTNQTSVLLNIDNNAKKVIFMLCAAFCLTPFAGPAVALLLGLAVAQLTGHPYLHLNHRATHLLLQVSVVGLGFGMNVQSAVQAGKMGVLFTVVSIAVTLITGFFVGKWFDIERKTSFLISAGTAICGGSAIAAISPVIKAEEKQISVALGCVFILNSVALFVFPVAGQYLNLSQTQYGLWCAIAIHDTSSVIGAAGRYGTKALEIATTIKLARALWIIPVTFMAGALFKSKGSKASLPYFIGLFVVAVVVNTYVPGVAAIGPYITRFAKAGLTLTLFLIGAGLSRTVLASVGFKPLLQGALLWVMISIGALLAVIHLA